MALPRPWEDASADVSRRRPPHRESDVAVSRRAGRIASACLTAHPAESSIEHDEACKTGMALTRQERPISKEARRSPRPQINIRPIEEREPMRLHPSHPRISSFRTLAALASVALLAVASTALTAQMGAAPGQPPKPMPSPPATASVTVAGGTIDIRYNTPQMRGRKIMGALSPTARSGAPARTPPPPSSLRSL